MRWRRTRCRSRHRPRRSRPGLPVAGSSTSYGVRRMLICLPGAIHAAEDRRSRPYGARLCRQYRRRSYTALLLISGMADSALLPLMLGCGVDVPVPIILVGALGGIIGMFA